MRYLVLILLLFYMGCSDTAGGTGTETTNGFVALSDGSPASGAVVRLRKSQDWYGALKSSESTLWDSTTCDANGFFDFGTLHDFSYTLEIIHGDEGQIVVDNHADSVVLASYCSFSGDVPTGVTAVYLGGSDYDAAVENGRYSFEKVAPGYYPVFVKKDDAIQLATTVEVTAATSELSIPTVKGLIFDNFTVGFETSPLNYLATQLYWYTFSDSSSFRFYKGEWELKQLSEHKGNTAIFPEISEGTMKLHVELGDKWDYPFAGIGAALLKDQTGLNLSSLDTIFLRARGAGIFRVSLESNLLDSASLSDYGALCTLSTAWKEFQIPVEDLHLRVRDSLFEKAQPWSTVSKQIDRIECSYQSLENSVNKALEIELDYLIWGGVSPDLL